MNHREFKTYRHYYLRFHYPQNDAQQLYFVAEEKKFVAEEMYKRCATNITLLRIVLFFIKLKDPSLIYFPSHF